MAHYTIKAYKGSSDDGIKKVILQDPIIEGDIYTDCLTEFFSGGIVKPDQRELSEYAIHGRSYLDGTGTLEIFEEVPRDEAHTYPEHYTYKSAVPISKHIYIAHEIPVNGYAHGLPSSMQDVQFYEGKHKSLRQLIAKDSLLQHLKNGGLENMIQQYKTNFDINEDIIITLHREYKPFHKTFKQ